MIKDRLGEEQLVLKNDTHYNDEEIGDQFSDFNILKVIRPKLDKEGNVVDDGKFVAKVSSKKNNKIYLMKRLKHNPTDEQMEEEFNKLKNLNHQNLIKYYKWFREKEKIYIIEEFVDNGGLSNVHEAYSTMFIKIEEDTLWNIFMQCMSGLEYIHNKNIIHKKISLNNILMTENKVIKLDDIHFSFIQNESQKDKSTDIKEMGEVFKKLMNEYNYSKEMEDLKNLMVKNKNDKNQPTAKTLLDLIIDKYIKKVAKVSSINSIFRCMTSFPDFIHEMKQNEKKFTENEQPVAYLFMKFLGDLEKDNENIYCNNFRNLLFKNSQINNDIEIRPTQVLEFLLERLNRETGTTSGEASFSTFKNEFIEKKNEAFDKFQNLYLKNFNSIISNKFVTYIKTKRLCNKCSYNLYSYHVYPFIEFDVSRMIKYQKRIAKIEGKEEIVKEIEFKEWFSEQNKRQIYISKEHKLICKRCNEIRDFREFKQFYYFPKCFIISLDKGENYNELPFKIPMELDLGAYREMNSSPKKYNLVGIVKRIVDEERNEYFIAFYKDHKKENDKKDNKKNDNNELNNNSKKKNPWKIFDKNGKNKYEENFDPLSHRKGMVTVLFYSAKDEIGQ